MEIDPSEPARSSSHLPERVFQTLDMKRFGELGLVVTLTKIRTGNAVIRRLGDAESKRMVKVRYQSFLLRAEIHGQNVRERLPH